MVLESVFGFSEPGGTFSTPNRYLVMEIITCQHEWVEQCQIRYRVEPPLGYHFEDAHYPEPECRNGIETVSLWYPDHIVQGALQTLNFQHPCMHGYRVQKERDILKEVYPEYLNIFEKAYAFCQKFASVRGCSKAGKIGGRVTKQRGVGIFDSEIRKQAMIKVHQDIYVGEKKTQANQKRAKTLGKHKLSEIARKTNLGRMVAITVTTCEGSKSFESIRQASKELNIDRKILYKSLKTGEEIKGILAIYNKQQTQ